MFVFILLIQLESRFSFIGYFNSAEYFWMANKVYTVSFLSVIELKFVSVCMTETCVMKWLFENLSHTCVCF